MQENERNRRFTFWLQLNFRPINPITARCQ
jgi:hypothetical protein